MTGDTNTGAYLMRPQPLPGPQQPPRDAYVAVVDIDPIKAHIGTYEFGADIRLIADTEITLGLLLAAVQKLAGAGDRTRFKERAARWADVSLARLRESERAAQAHSKKSPISPLWLSYQIGRHGRQCLMLDETPCQPAAALSVVLPARHLLPQRRQPVPGLACSAGRDRSQRRRLASASGDAAARRSCRQTYQNRKHTGTRAIARFYLNGYSKVRPRPAC